MLPGTERLLAELDAAAQQLGRSTWTIVTSCTRPLFEARWATTGLPLPDGLVTADQVTDGKPDPEPYLLGARRLGVHPIGALVIEDSVGGLRSGTDAGSRTLAVTSTTPASVLRPLADALIDRKSTRLNSSHVAISYAVFCLKKKSVKDVTDTLIVLKSCEL